MSNETSNLNDFGRSDDLSSDVTSNFDKRIVISLDCMGGDNAPFSVISAANDVIAFHDHDVFFRLHGDEELINKYLYRFPNLRKFCEVIHATELVLEDEKPSSAIRKSDSGMKKAVLDIRNNVANAAISCGNTGALMAISKLTLRTLPKIDRPAICCTMPTIAGKPVVMLDVGANIKCEAYNLCQFGIMGAAFARAMFKISKPKIGVLNVGSEELKGNESVQSAYATLKENIPDSFAGYVEGDDIFKGEVDVVVTDGFSGNIALKSSEGAAKLCIKFTKDAFRDSIFSKIGYLFAYIGMNKLRKKLDPRLYNGAMFLGLNGIVIKSHGNSDRIGFANAIKVAISLATDDINSKILGDIENSNFI